MELLSRSLNDETCFRQDWFKRRAKGEIFASNLFSMMFFYQVA
jgi:hypothetical protein